MHAVMPDQVLPAATRAVPTEEPFRTLTRHTLVLELEGITADDYLQWIRDPDPAYPGGLKLVAVRTAALGDRIQLELISAGEPPPPHVATHAVGFPITPEVTALLTPSARRRTPRRDPTARALNLIEDLPPGQPSTGTPNGAANET